MKKTAMLSAFRLTCLVLFAACNSQLGDQSDVDQTATGTAAISRPDPKIVHGLRRELAQIFAEPADASTMRARLLQLAGSYGVNGLAPVLASHADRFDPVFAAFESSRVDLPIAFGDHYAEPRVMTRADNYSAEQLRGVLGDLGFGQLVAHLRMDRLEPRRTDALAVSHLVGVTLVQDPWGTAVIDQVAAAALVEAAIAEATYASDLAAVQATLLNRWADELLARLTASDREGASRSGAPSRAVPPRDDLYTHTLRVQLALFFEPRVNALFGGSREVVADPALTVSSAENAQLIRAAVMQMHRELIAQRPIVMGGEWQTVVWQPVAAADAWLVHTWKGSDVGVVELLFRLEGAYRDLLRRTVRS